MLSRMFSNDLIAGHRTVVRVNSPEATSPIHGHELRHGHLHEPFEIAACVKVIHWPSGVIPGTDTEQLHCTLRVFDFSCEAYLYPGQ